MSTNLNTAEKMKEDHKIPDVIMPFVVAHPRLLPGETADEYYRLFGMMALQVLPDDDIEWLAVIDLTHLQWDIQRLRRWKHAIIANSRASAIETALCKTHPAAAQSGSMSIIRAQSRMNALEMIANPKAHRNLFDELAAYGYDADGINAGAFAHSIVPLTTIEKFLSTARHQVILTLREIAVRRELARRMTESQERMKEVKKIEMKQQAAGDV